MAATDGQHKASVVIDGKVTADVEVAKLTKKIDELERAVARSSQATTKQSLALDIAQARAQNTADRFSKFDDAVTKANESTAKSAAALGKGSKAAQAFGSAIKQVETGQASLRQGIMGVAAAFGPLGIAVGVAGSALVGFVQHELEARDAAEAAANALKKQRRELKETAEATALAERNERRNARETADYQTDRRHEYERYLDSVSEEKQVLEETIAIQEGRGKNVSALLTRQAEMRAEALEHEARYVRSLGSAEDGGAAARAEAERLEREAVQVLRDDKLRLLREEGDLERQNTEEKHKQLKLAKDINAERDLKAAFQSPNFRSVASWGEDQRFAAGLREAAPIQIQRVDPTEVAANSQSQLGATVINLEEQRARKDITSIEQAEQLEQAQLAHLETLEALQQGEQYLDERRQVRHEAEMARIAEEQRAHDERDKAIDKGAKIATQAASIMVTSLVATSDARREAVRQARLQGKTESEAAKAGEIAALEQQAANLMAIRNILLGIAVEEGVRALASFARYDFVGGGLHLAAAAAAGAGAAIVGSRAKSELAGADALAMSTDGFASGGSFGGSASGSSGSPGGDVKNRGGVVPPGSDSEIPGSPNPEAPTAASTGPHRGGPVVHIHGPIHTYGIPERDFINRITEGQRDSSYERTPRRAAS